VVELRIHDQVVSMSWEAFEREVLAGRVPPQALVRFEPVTEQSWVRADSLEAFNELMRSPDAHAAKTERALTPPLLTALLVGVQVRLWWLSNLPGVGEGYLDHGSSGAAPVFEDLEVWRLLTMGLLHVEWQHLTLNLLFFAYLSWNMERLLGRGPTAVVFFGSVLGGSLMSVVMTPYAFSLGASGGIFGLLGASVVMGLVQPERIPARTRARFGVWMAPYLALMLWSGFNQVGVDNWSHMGGLATGAFLICLFLLPAKRPQRRLLYSGATLVGVPCLVALGGPHWAPLTHANPAVHDNDRDASSLHWTRPGAWTPGVNLAGDLGFSSPDTRRSWSVTLTESRERVELEVRADRWVQQIQRAWPEASHEPLAPRICAPDVQGMGTTVRLTLDDEPLRLEWCGALRGVWFLQTVWEVGDDDAERLRPLKRRLEERLVWHEALDLQRARALWDEGSTRPKLRQMLASALGRSGRCDEAVELLRPVIEAQPDSPALWLSMFDILDLGDEDCAAPATWWDRALKATPALPVKLRVAQSMMEHDEWWMGVAMLDLLWGAHPGDYTVRNARSAVGLSQTMDIAVSLPWGLMYRLDSGAQRPEDEVERMQAMPLGTDSARQWAARTQTERGARIQTLNDPDSDPWAVLSIACCGAPPERPQGDRSLIQNGLQRAVNGTPPPWVTNDLQAIAPDLLARLAAEASP